MRYYFLLESIVLRGGKHCFAGWEAMFCGLGSYVLLRGEPYPSPVRGGRRQRIYLHKDVPIGSGKMAA
ncbi:hypothetical protein [Mediterranea massiliensis]|uniref:hypothetical protein n=1 Tax=Mediterranea massiliensis TaxID=1841865 RepID=UPI0023F029ED|nr:hypothetical protein [Mediterranea massiliensis]